MEKLSPCLSALTWEEIIVKTENLNVYYGNVHALKNVNVKRFLENLTKLGISKEREEEILEIFGLKDQIN